MGFSRFMVFLRRSATVSSQQTWFCRNGSSKNKNIILLNPFFYQNTRPIRPWRGFLHPALLSTSALEAHKSEITDPKLDFGINGVQEPETHDTQQGNLETHRKTEEESDWERSLAEEKSCAEGGKPLRHPWPEWVALMEHLVQNNYFKTFADDVDNKEPLSNVLKDSNHVRNACLNFGRDRFDILRSLSKEDIRKIVEYGCPILDRKVVNSGKRLRSYVNIEEGDVCSKCNVRSSCDRAYISPPKEEGARTVDVMRILLTYGIDPLGSPVENKLHTKKAVKASVCKLLKQVVELSATPLDPNLPRPLPMQPHPTIKRVLPSPIKRIARVNVEMKKGDWPCPRCNIINFARNMACIQCHENRPRNPLSPGEWECPDCNFLNFSRNMKCLNCDCKRPKDEMQLNPGDWNCPRCNFLNFRRNMTCRECDCKCPRYEDAEITLQPNTGDWKCPECSFMNFGRNMTCLKCNYNRPNGNTEIARPLNAGDWNCPECKFLNFRRNMTCLRCNCKRPKDDHSEIGRWSRNNHWADDISGLQQSKHISQRSLGVDGSSSSGINENDFSDIDLDDDDIDYNQNKVDRGKPSRRLSYGYDRSSINARKGGGSNDDNFNFDDFPVRGGKIGIAAGRRSELKGKLTSNQRSSGVDRLSSSMVSANDVSDLDLDDDNDDDDVGYSEKRADSGRSSRRVSHRYGASSTTARGKGKAYDDDDDTDDEDGWFGGRRGKELRPSDRSLPSKPKQVKESFESFGNLDNDNDIHYDKKKASGRRSSGRVSHQYGGSATNARGKGKAGNYEATDDEDDWFVSRSTKVFGSSKRSSISEPKSEEDTFEKLSDWDEDDDLFESKDEQPRVSRTENKGEARSGNDKRESRFARRPSSTSQEMKRVEYDDGLDDFDDVDDNENNEDPFIVYDKIREEEKHRKLERKANRPRNSGNLRSFI